MPTYWSCGVHGTSGTLTAHRMITACPLCERWQRKVQLAKDRVVEAAEAAAYADPEDMEEKMAKLSDAVAELTALKGKAG